MQLEKTQSFPDSKEDKSLFDDHETIRNQLYQQVETPKFLFFGMPDRAKHFTEMNVAQPPQGPKLNLKNFSFLSDTVRGYINKKFEMVFNPKKESPYSGLDLIRQNLERDLPGVSVKLVDHPKRDEILNLIEQEYFPIIGLAIGCENQIPDAEKLVEEIQKRYRKWTDMIKFLLSGKKVCPEWIWKIPGVESIEGLLKNWALKELKKRFGEKLALRVIERPELLDHLAPIIVSGNYGASAAKKIFGDKTSLNKSEMSTKILWDDIEERKQKRERGEEPYIGEGVHDMRIFLQNLGYQILSGPNDPIVSKAVAESNPAPKNPFQKWLMETMGMIVAPTTKVNLNTATGCKNQCAFCNTATHFQREKRFLFRNVDEMFNSIMEKVRENKNNTELMPETCVWILDENMGQSDGGFERMCELVEKSGENIRWGTSTDIKSLISYKKKHGDFRGLVRGGLNSLWLGIESKADFFDKRGKADAKQVEKLVKELQSLGIVIIGSFIVGLPIHTEEETVINNDGSYKKLNIYEDMEWCRSLDTAANQIMMYTETILVKGEKSLTEKLSDDHRTSIDLLGVDDYTFGHKTVNNQTDIPDDKLEQIDRTVREEFYRENGPVVLRQLMTLWEGYKTFKNSSNPVETRAADYYYWMVRRYLHLVSLATVYFSESIFEKCSDDFLQRLAVFLSEADYSAPPETELSSCYKKIMERHEEKIFEVSKFIAEYLRNRFIQKVNARKQQKTVLALQAL